MDLQQIQIKTSQIINFAMWHLQLSRTAKKIPLFQVCRPQISAAAHFTMCRTTLNSSNKSCNPSMSNVLHSCAWPYFAFICCVDSWSIRRLTIDNRCSLKVPHRPWQHLQACHQPAELQACNGISGWSYCLVGFLQWEACCNLLQWLLLSSIGNELNKSWG